MNRFENRVAIVTGAGGGLGRAYTLGLAKEGASVVIAEYSEEAGKNVEKELHDLGLKGMYVHCDVSSEEDVKNVVAATIKEYGQIDILINNAHATGKTAEIKTIEETDVKLFELNWRTGIFGTFMFMHYCLPYMKEKRYGRIINVGSSDGVDGKPGRGAYGATKEAIRGLTRVCANEYGQFGITCNVICPASIPSKEQIDLLKKANPEYFEQIEAIIPLRYIGTPDDVAPAVLFLASDDARYVTGQTLGVNGGLTQMQ